MGVYIKGQDLPKEGEHYLIQINSDGTVYDAVGRRIAAQAVSVPPHGRFGDLDALHKLFLEKAKEYKGAGGAMVAMAALCIANAPTIIEAEEGET